MHLNSLPTEFYDAGIAHLELSARDYASLIGSPYVDEDLAGIALVIVHDAHHAIPHPGSLPVVVCTVSDRFGGDGPSNADVRLSDDDLPELMTSLERSPVAATTLALLLRSLEHAPVEIGLAMESAAYSVLQAGAEFTTRLASRSPPSDNHRIPVVTVHRDRDHLAVTLDRPHRHNAIDTQLRDELCEALAIAIVDSSIRTVSLHGNGPSFCSGGDLDDFGRFPDPALAHVTRLARSPARLIHTLRDRITVHVHGYTLGGGIEMAAFSRHLVADRNTIIALPEIEVGLLPGAGGTVSLTNRIGRHRTAALALTGRRIDTDTALEWGLVDQIAPALPIRAS